LWSSGWVNESIDGIAKGSPLLPGVPNFFMEDFEEKALTVAAYKLMTRS
jgi:hypothetical protein